jgi:hypothetical protein
MLSTATNYHPTIEKGQGFPPPPWTRKSPDNCFLSYIDQIPTGYTGSKLVRNTPRKTSDTYFVVRTMKTSVRSIRRNFSHRSVALFKTKAGGATRANIEYMTCSFLELDGSTDNSIKTRKDVFSFCSQNSIPKPSYTIETSRGHFHLIWNYTNPLPFTEKGESYWLAQQARLVELFQKGGVYVEIRAF